MSEVLTFGPRMAHDDTIETLYYALKNAFPVDPESDSVKELENPYDWGTQEVPIEKNWKVL